jgi:NitT/TauT family transport system ATP-binding protein
MLADAPTTARRDQATREQPTLQFRTVGRNLASLPVLQSIELEVARGSFVALVGPSGCGKTTLLNLAAGLVRPDEGTVLYNGAPLLKPNTDAGYLTQDDALLPWRDVLSNIALPLEVKKVDKATRTEAARRIIRKVGLAGFEHHRPAQLSGGMRKRVSLARTLIYQPATLLLDEPFAALDAQTRMLMQNQLLELTRELSLTVLLVTHDIAEAIALADRIILLTARPARIVDAVDVSQADRREIREEREHALFARIWNHLAEQTRDTGSSDGAP